MALQLVIPINSQLKLQAISIGDATLIFNAIITQKDYLGQWLPALKQTQCLNDTVNFIRSLTNPLEQVFTIRYNDQFAGLISFNTVDVRNSKLEIGYWLMQQYQGKGIMTQAVKHLINYAFTELQVNRIQIKCAVSNLASKAIPERLGLQLEGIERQGLQLDNGKFYDLAIYSMLAQDWNR